ncbi:DUF2024 family protein [uncultured Lacinutrix sp.]|uniref:DUF2024 family protein n=1 Tax=uncultured Lacinutrix sp. TaxID=574032 RepID=UPI0026270D70|nr:DUF2024 family protein [uncultured Lacinutrix sp.]
MKIAVWDTYVEKEDGIIMHFDILVPDQVTDKSFIFDFGMHYLNTKPFKTGQITTKECRFCHIEEATEDMIASIAEKGYTIIEMENCN